MAYQFDFDSTNRILRGRFAQEVNDEEVIDYYRTAAFLGGSLRPPAAITDLSSATVSVSAQTIEKLAKLPPAMPKPSRPRFIVAPSDHSYGLARMFQIAGQATRPNLHVTRSTEEMWDALGEAQQEFGPVPDPVQ